MKLSFIKKIIPYLIDLAIIALIVFFSISFLQDAYLTRVPTGDIFQFISDGEIYGQWRLPEPIFIPPANPILVNILAGFLDQKYPEVLAAFLISTWSVILLLFVAFLFLRKKIKNKVILIPFFILLVSNQVLMEALWSGNSNALFGLLIFINLIVYEKSKKLAYLLSAVLILVRYEAVALFATFLLIDFYFSFCKSGCQKILKDFNFKKLTKQLWFKYALIGLSIITTWFVFVHFWNRYFGHHYGIYYIHEVFSRSKSIPNFKFLLKFSNLFVGKDWWWDNQTALINSLLTQLSFLFLLFSFLVALQQKHKIVLNHIVFIGIYLAIHSFFPAANYRYFFPILIPALICHFYLLDYFLEKLKNHESAFLFRITTIFLIFSLSISVSKFNFIENEIKRNVMSNRHAEIKATVQWIGDQEFVEKKHVVGFNMFPYFNKNLKVVYLRYFHGCNSVRCVLDREGVGRDVWVVKNAASQISTQFKINEMGGEIFNNELEKTCLSEIHRIDVENDYEWEDERWAVVYNYDYEACKNLDLGDSY